jgi:metal-responsive CopG/Arc/MetJ family transcriptional regulator
VQNEKEEKQLVNFNCPTKLLQEFDKRIRGRYGDRTDALCAAMRMLLEKLPKEA